MSYVKPAAARHTAIDFGDQLAIAIPSRKQWFQLPFLIFWLMGWTFGELAALNDIAQRGLNGSGLFLLVWVTFWTIGGAMALLTLLWILLGREMIIMDGRLTLTHRREILGVGRSKNYDLSLIQDLRTVTLSLPRPRQWPGWQNYGVIAFDYGAKTIRIGNSLDEAEAKQIIRVLGKYMPIQ
ncbi:MAG: hypothetical protein GY803_32745 [Chloroflexi bacterium]|nr:hypothetical protein [Chloroflexota bacterium]